MVKKDNFQKKKLVIISITAMYTLSYMPTTITDHIVETNDNVDFKSQ